MHTAIDQLESTTDQDIGLGCLEGVGGTGGCWVDRVGEISNSGKNTLIQPTHTLKQWALNRINLVLGGLGSVTAGSGYSMVCLVWRCHLSEARLQLEQ
jgi:hypothetical protein